MLAFLEEQARTEGVQVIQLAVDVRNPDKQAYERAGFQAKSEGMIKWLD